MISQNLTRTTVRIATLCCVLVLLLLPATARAQFQTVTIPVGNGPIALALNQTTHKLYVAIQGSNSVYVIDTDPNNPTFNTVVAGPLAVGSSPSAIAVNETTDKIYVANSGSASVTEIDGGSNSVVATIVVNTLPTNPPTTFVFHPASLAINPNTNQIYVGNADCSFAAIDGNTNNVRHPDYPGLCGEQAVAVNLNTNKVYVGSQGDLTIQLYSEAANTSGVFSNTLMTTFNSNHPIAIAVDPSANVAYVADLLNEVEVIDEASQKETAQISGFAGPYTLGVNPNTHKVYVLNQSTSGPAALAVVGGTAIIGSVAVGNLAAPARVPADEKVLVDPVANLVYVANDGSNSVTVIDGNTDTVLFTFPTGSQPFALAKDSAAGNVYVANFSSGTAGSVTVLEVAPSSANLFSSTSYIFGPQAVGTTSPAQLVTLINHGATSLTVSSIVPSGDFSETDNCISMSNPPIPVGGSCTIQVTFTPTAGGTRDGQLTVTDSDPSSPQVITLSGTGTGAGLTVTPSSLVFGATIINQGSNSQGVTVTNTGATPLVFQFTSTNVIGDFSIDNGCTPATSATTLQIPPGGACTVEVQFFPTAGGVRSGQLLITEYSSGSGVNYNLPLTGFGIAAQGVEPLAPSLVFGSQLVGTTSPGLVETLTNAGFTNLSVGGVIASGDFRIAANNCGAKVVPQTSCEFIVTFTPTRSGPRTGQVLVFDNQGYSPQTIALSGVGSPVGVTLAPATLSFGMQTSAVQGLPQTVTLTNTGTSNVTISSITPDGDEDWVETDNCTSPAFGPIPAGGSCTITVTERPITIGRLTGLGQIIIVDSDPSSPHFIGLAAAGTGLQLSVSPSFLSGPGVVSVFDTLFQPLISKVQAVGGWMETDTCSPPAFTLTTCAVTVSGGSGVGQITIDDVNHTNGPMIVALAGPYSIASLMNTPANVPAGPAENVLPIDAGTGTSPVSLTFPGGSITTGGITSLTIQSSGPQPPSGFQLGTPPVYYYIQTTAVFSGAVTICITSPSVTSTSQLIHFGSGGTVNIPSTVSGDTICGITSSFSPFAIAQPVGKISTSLGLTSSANPSAAGQPVTFTAAFGGTGFPPSGAPSPTGSVTFLDGSIPLGAPVSLPTSGAIAFTTNTLSAGSHSITAQYSGDGTYAGSSSNLVGQTVSQTATSLSLTSSSNPSLVGQTLTFTAALSGTNSVPSGVPAPTGTIILAVDGAVFGSPESLSAGSAVISITSLAAGSHTVSAQYSGDGDYAASSSNVVTQVVNKNVSTTSFGASATSVTLGQTITLNASVAGAGTGSLPPGLPAPTGFVTFFDGSTPLGSAVTLPASLPAMLSVNSLAAGTHSLTAHYSGDANYAASVSAPVQVTVTNNATSISLTSTGPSVYGQPVTFSANVIAAGGGTLTGNVAFIDTASGTPLGSSMVNSSGAATLQTSSLAAGTHAIAATYAGNGTLAASTSPTLSELVSPAPLSVTAVPAAGNNISRPYGANNPAVSPVIAGIVNGDPISVSDMTTAAPSSPVGVYAVTAAISDPANRLGNYVVTSVNGTLTVVPETTVLTVVVLPSSIVVGQSSTATITLTAQDMVIPIDSSVLASVSLTSAIASDVISNGGGCTPVPTPAAGTASCTLTVTSSAPNGRTLTANFAGSAALVASTGSAQLIVTEPVEGQQSCIQSDFRNVAVPGGSYIWLNSIFRVRDVSKQVVHVSFANSTVQYQYTDASGNPVSVNLAVPNARITIDPSVTVASTSFDPVNNVWNTTLPWDLDDNAFLSGTSWLVPAAGLPADVEPVNWCGTFAVDVPGAHVGWRWAAAAYSSAFNAANAVLGVKPMDTDGDNPEHHDLAGTPENYKQFVIPGARGKGGQNYTGSYSRSAAIE